MTDGAPLVSVLLTSYNRPVMLGKAIDSVLAQTCRDFELIILDDNSDDPEVPRVIAGCWADPHVRIYKSSVRDRRKRLRYAAQINTGLALAEGKYVSYLCDDDWYYPDRLERMTAILEAGGPAAVVYGAQHLMNAAGLIRIRPAEQVLTSASGKVDHASVMHLAKIGRDVGGWPEEPGMWNMGDAFFWDRLTEAGHLFYPVPGPVTDAHLYHPGDSRTWGPVLYGAPDEP